MAPINPTNTPRYRFKYDVSGVKHDFQVRSHASPSAIGALVDAFLVALTDALYAIVMETVEFAASGSDIFLPVTSGIEGNGYSTGAPPAVEIPNFYGFQGRSAGGRKWHLDMYGARTLGIDFRLSPGENSDVTNAVNALQDFGSNLVAIDDEVVTVYTYVNCGTNAHWQRAQRT